MTQIPGAWITTLVCPTKYTRQQIDKAADVAHALQRGQFILTEPPRRA